MVEDLHRQRVLNFLDAFYSGDTEAALACCDDDFDSITHAPIELFPHLGHKHGKDWVAEAIRAQQKRYSSRRYEILSFVIPVRSDAQLHTGESRDSGFARSARAPE
jgi:hypothetical protein